MLIGLKFQYHQLSCGPGVRIEFSHGRLVLGKVAHGSEEDTKIADGLPQKVSLPIFSSLGLECLSIWSDIFIACCCFYALGSKYLK